MADVNQVPSIGEIFAGKFRIAGVLGDGGMGVVYEATHLFLNQRVAIKFLQPVLAQHQHLVARFVREARAASSISSEHVARVLDVAVTESGTPYMVMEFLPGVDLAQLIRDRGKLPIAEAIDYVLQASEAIAEAHKLGIVHRDLKPANLFLMVRADGSKLVKVFDFGISKSLPKRPSLPQANTTDSDAEITATKTITKTGDVVGSPLYMSPEQFMDSKRVDERTDVWALGAILYEMLSGSPPFNGEDAVAVLARMVTMPPPSLCKTHPELPARLEEIIFRCLEKDVNRRVENVAELAEALEPFAPAASRMSVRRIVSVLRGVPMPAVTEAARARGDRSAKPGCGRGRDVHGAQVSAVVSRARP